MIRATQTNERYKAKFPHFADVECGMCGDVTAIRLGGCSAIVCQSCQAEIRLCDCEPDDDYQAIHPGSR